jgi:hypothetical protein
MACALAAAAISTQIAGRKFVRTRAFWITTVVVFALTFLLTSAITLLHSASHHGRAHQGRVIEMGYPAVYLREYAGESWNAMNLALDLAICFAVALLCVAVLSGKKTDQSI